MKVLKRDRKGVMNTESNPLILFVGRGWKMGWGGEI